MLTWKYKAVFSQLRESIRLDLISPEIVEELDPPSLNMPSITDISVEVVSMPQNALQSLTTHPAPITSLPLLTVPATNGIWNNDESSSKSSTVVFG